MKGIQIALLVNGNFAEWLDFAYWWSFIGGGSAIDKATPCSLRKTSQDCKMLPRVHLIGCQGVKLFLPKDSLQFGQKLSCQNLSFVFGHNLSLSFVTI